MNLTDTGKLNGYAVALAALKEADRLRALKPRAGTHFASNDYLALASAPRMKKALFTALDAGTPVGVGGHGSCAAIARSTKLSKRRRRSSSGRRQRFSLAAVTSQISLF
ncbi:7-keto-8-aminopelargonate synthetase-like enzyme [Bradyrhizobium sp. JR6.1]